MAAKQVWKRFPETDPKSHHIRVKAVLIERLTKNIFCSIMEGVLKGGVGAKLFPNLIIIFMCEAIKRLKI